MKNTILIFFISISVLNCSENKVFNKEDNDSFKASFDTIEEINKLLEKSKELKAFNEPLLRKNNSNKEIIRIHDLPSLEYPYLIKFTKFQNKSNLLVKITDGYEENYPGKIVYEEEFSFENTSYYDSIAQILIDINFRNIPYMDNSCRVGKDGNIYVIEYFKDNVNNIRLRWSPENCGNKKTNKLGLLITKIRKDFKIQYKLDSLIRESTKDES